MNLYATLADARRAAKATSHVDDDVLVRNLSAVSRRVDRIMRASWPLFQPWYGTQVVSPLPSQYSRASGTLILPRPVLELVDVTQSDQAVLNVTLDVVGGISVLRVPDCGALLRCGTPLSVRAWWGIHTQPHAAYRDAGLLLTACDASARTIALNTLIADDWSYREVISEGVLLRVGDELMEVTRIVTPESAAVRRGVNGTISSAHALAAPVRVYEVEPAIRDVVARQAAFKYARRGAYESATITDLGTVTYPADLLSELRNVVGTYAAY